MNVLLSLLPLIATAAGGCGAAAADLPAPDEAVKNCDAKQIKIVVCDGGDNLPDYKYDENKGKDSNTESPSTRPMPRPRQDGSEGTEANANYRKMKEQLDENFKIMFELKKELDASQSRMSAKWEEYYALQQAYNKQLQKIVASWVTDSLY